MATQQVKLEWNGERVSSGMRREAKSRLLAASEHFREALVVKLSGSRSGREYRIPGTGRTYTASAPGEPPAVRLGGLRQSIKTEITEERDEIKADIGTDLDYGLFLERGTRNIRPRPWLKPTFDEQEDQIKSIIGGEEWTL